LGGVRLPNVALPQGSTLVSAEIGKLARGAQTFLVPQEGEIGRFSFSPDGERIAFECIRSVPWVGAVRRSVRILSLATGKETEINVPTAKASAVFNPLWSPTGRHLALGCLMAEPDPLAGAAEIRAGVLDLETGQWQFLVEPSPYYWKTIWEWSSDGKWLLVHGQRPECALGMLWVVPTPPAEGAADRPGISSQPWTHQACFSPDCMRVAVLEGQARTLAQDTNTRVVVVGGIGGESRELTMAPVIVPTGLRPVAIDW
jgi:dipeptidyl aminopeptidase/acylaminoacyl peptidase